MLANLFGDFVKGSNFHYFSSKIREGIVLHRAIDTFIDQHKDVLDLKLMLYQDLPKVAGVAVDLFFDHLLAKTWQMHHVQEYQTFLNDFYHHNSEIENDLTSDFKQFITIFRERKWLDHYPTVFGLAKSCEGVSKRISFENKLAEAPDTFYKREKEIEAVFQQYMEDAKNHFSVINSIH
ncbi:MAG: acyl carrier protein phosphodiesterase [Bacteroidetes bacterium]|nr:acyl carrier protein phosphodiesterase [Bacteroidota bacterium]